MQVTGTVSQRYDNENNVVLEVNGERYSAYKGKGIPPTAQAGASVSFTMVEKGNFKNIMGDVAVTGGGTEAPAQQAAAPSTAGGVDARQAFIMKQNAMTNAVAMAALLGITDKAAIFALADEIYQSYLK